MIALLLTYWRIPVVRQGVLAAFATSFAAYVAWVGVLVPARERADHAQRTLTELTVERSVLEQRRSLAPRYATLSASVVDINDRLAVGADRSSLVRRFTDLSQEAGTRIVHGANSLGTPKGDVVPVLQDLTVEGRYAEIRRFLELVGELESLTLLLSVEITSDPLGARVRARMRFMTLTRGSV
ncbi:MAG: hypothetical protein AAGI50_16785 [Pseudomonadota bacterium]